MKITKTLCLNKSCMRHEMNRKDHNMGSYTINKISFSADDDTKYIIEEGYSRLSHIVGYLVVNHQKNLVE